MFQTYRSKLIVSFMVFILLGLFIASVCILYNKEVKKLDSILLQAKDIHSSIILDSKFIGNFFSYAPTDVDFHQKNNSKELLRHREILDQIFIDLDKLTADISLHMEGTPHSLNEIRQLLHKKNEHIQYIKELLLERGYKQYGEEGIMRANVHKLERIPGFKLEDVLSLRRREKDYIIRFDKKYSRLLVQESRAMLAGLEKSNLEQLPKDIAAHHLKEYVKHFQEIVKLDFELGIRNQQGLKGEIDGIQADIDQLLNESLMAIEQRVDNLLQRFFRVYIVTLGFIFLLGILISLYFSSVLTKNLKWLAHSISAFIAADFNEGEKKEVPKVSNDEIGALTNNFLLLKEKMEVYIRELTEEKEAANKANESKSLFLANMSHEIRTPMNGVLGITQLLKDSGLTEAQQEYLDILSFSSKKLLSIINDILDFSKIESGKLRLENIPISIGEELDKVIKVLRPKASTKGLDLIFDHDQAIPKWVKGDPTRFNQIFFNLIGNAIKFTEKGEVRITTHLIRRKEGKLYVNIQVKDTGIGISQEGQEKLFQAFSQADDSTTRKFGGTGLGLAISQELAHLMEGDIGVDSNIGEGSTFWVEVPIIEVVDEKTPNVNQPLGSFEQMGARVLLVEDNLVNQKSLA